MAELILHIGMHKTATTYIQNILYDNRDMLFNEGIIYPDIGIMDGAHHLLGGSINHGMALGRFERHKNKKFNEISEISHWQQLASLVNEKPNFRYIISTEEFEWLTSPETLINFLKEINFDKIKIVAGIRRQDYYLESLYQQFVKDNGPRLRKPISQWIGPHSFIFYDKVFEPWIKAVGKNNISIFTFEEAVKHGLLETYLKQLSIPESVSNQLKINKQSVVQQKESLDARLLEFLRICNFSQLDRERRNNLFSCLQKANVLIEKAEGRIHKNILSVKDRVNILEATEESNKKLLSTFFPGKSNLFPELSERDKEESPKAIRDIIKYLIEAKLF